MNAEPPVALHQAGETEAAEALAHAVLKSKRNHGNAMALLGRTAFDRRRYEEAVDWHRKSINTDRKSATYLCNLANSLLALGRFTEATASFERAIKLKSDFAPAIAGLADALDRRGKSKRARDMLEPYIKRPNATGKMLLVFARAEQSLDNHESVVQLATDAADNKRFSDAVRGNLLLLAGRSCDALGDAASSAASRP